MNYRPRTPDPLPITPQRRFLMAAAGIAATTSMFWTGVAVFFGASVAKSIGVAMMTAGATLLASFVFYTGRRN